MVWLPGGETILKMCLFVLTERTKVRDGRTHRQTDTARRQAALAYSIARQKPAAASEIDCFIIKVTQLYSSMFTLYLKL